MSERELVDAVQLSPEKLFWVAMHRMPLDSARSHYFSIDEDFVYEPFSQDFGPLNLSCVHRYCRILDDKMRDPDLQAKRIIHCCSHDPTQRANAAFLICAYQVVVLGIAAEIAYAPFAELRPTLVAYRDATNRSCNFQLTVLDCLMGLQKSIEFGWFDWKRFDCDAYDYFQQVEHGDMNWIIPGKFIAFAGPCPSRLDQDGFQALTPEDYALMFKDANIGLVVRLNKNNYDRKRFIDRGIKHVDLYFLDGSCPPRDVISSFLHIAECEPEAIAVHCNAGLGRTGTLIGLYAMKHYPIAARAYIGWNRIARPGSILGPQQQFLCNMQCEMAAGSGPRRWPSPSPAGAENSTKLCVQERKNLEQYEFNKQGWRSRNANRGSKGLVDMASGGYLATQACATKLAIRHVVLPHDQIGLSH